MNLRGRSVALYGRFSPGVRDRLGSEVAKKGGKVTRDLTRASDVFVSGGLAFPLIDSGALGQRLKTARERNVPTYGERAFELALTGGATEGAATLPVATALASTRLRPEDIDLLAAFDLVAIDDDKVRFGDAQIVRTANELLDQGGHWSDVVRALTGARDRSPEGRHRVVFTAAGSAALKWSDGLTSLDGQGLLPLDEEHASLEDLFERAAIAEAEGDLEEAAHLYDLSTRADRSDAIAPYNLANIRLSQERWGEAALAYRRALVRDAKLVEARYNLAQALDAAGKSDEASGELEKALETDPAYADAVFNLARLRMKSGDLEAAKALYERYLALDPPDDWAAKARKAVLYCTAHLAGVAG
jgi:tetratricopeptide (TPR) repeat protein